MKTINLLTTALLVLTLASCTTLTNSVVNEPIEADNQGRTVGEVIDDNNMETRLRVNLNKLDPRFEQARVNVTANVGVVLLTGQVPDQAMIRQATDLLRDDTRIKAIHNHLTVAENSSLATRTNDQWLATKIRSRMFTTDYFPSSDVEVIVEKGVVYLMGRVSNDIAEKAVKITTEVNGVQKIVVVFDIT